VLFTNLYFLNNTRTLVHTYTCTSANTQMIVYTLAIYG